MPHDASTHAAPRDATTHAAPHPTDTTNTTNTSSRAATRPRFCAVAAAAAAVAVGGTGGAPEAEVAAARKVLATGAADSTDGSTDGRLVPAIAPIPTPMLTGGGAVVVSGAASRFLLAASSCLPAVSAFERSCQAHMILTSHQTHIIPTSYPHDVNGVNVKGMRLIVS